MPDIPMDTLGLFALFAGGVAWVLAGVVNKWLDPKFDPADVARVKALVSLIVLAVCAFIGFFALNAIRNTVGDEKGFFAMLVASFAAQKMLFLTTDSLIGFGKATPTASVADAPDPRVDKILEAKLEDAQK